MNLDLDLLQWPAMALTVTASWLIGSKRSVFRHVGFWLFLGSNVLWAVWGVQAHATALVILQVALAALNVRGMTKTESPADSATAKPSP